MKRSLKTLLLVFVVGLMGFSTPPSPPPMDPFGSHTWDFSEVFSNFDGSIQFIELRECCGGPGETGLPGHTLTSGSRSWVIPGGALTPPTSNKFYLIATPGFAALPGAPTPDAIIPAGSVPFFNNGGDTLSYVPWDTWAFPAIPTDGVNSRKRDGTTSVNNPTNYAGTTNSIVAPTSVPAMPSVGMIVMICAAVLIGAILVARRPRAQRA
jgi:hypothetical protein